jgi:hypothetical protein
MEVSGPSDGHSGSGSSRVAACRGRAGRSGSAAESGADPPIGRAGRKRRPKHVCEPDIGVLRELDGRCFHPVEPGVADRTSRRMDRNKREAAPRRAERGSRRSCWRTGRVSSSTQPASLCKQVGRDGAGGKHDRGEALRAGRLARSSSVRPWSHERRSRQESRSPPAATRCRGRARIGSSTPRSSGWRGACSN